MGEPLTGIADDRGISNLLWDTLQQIIDSLDIPLGGMIFGLDSELVFQ